jgi:hypothetical protein
MSPELLVSPPDLGRGKVLVNRWTTVSTIFPSVQGWSRFIGNGVVDIERSPL